MRTYANWAVVSLAADGVAGAGRSDGYPGYCCSDGEGRYTNDPWRKTLGSVMYCGERGLFSRAGGAGHVGGGGQVAAADDEATSSSRAACMDGDARPTGRPSAGCRRHGPRRPQMDGRQPETRAAPPLRLFTGRQTGPLSGCAFMVRRSCLAFAAASATRPVRILPSSSPPLPGRA